MKTNWPICTVEYTQTKNKKTKNNNNNKKKNTTMSSSMDVLRDYH